MALCMEVQGMTFTSTLPVLTHGRSFCKELAEDFFVCNKAKKQVFNDHFTLQFSSEVNLDEIQMFQDLKHDFYTSIRYMKKLGKFIYIGKALEAHLNGMQ